MEGKAALFKRFAGVDAWPVCLDTQDTDQIVEIVRAIAPVYGGINLEDISAPRCFEIEARLRELLDIPVFHDDQHGTAIVVLAALTNALRVVGKRLQDVSIVVSGVGAAGHAIIRLLHAQGAGSIIGCDRHGAVHAGQPERDEFRAWIATHTNLQRRQGTLKEVLAGADVFVGVSGAQPADRRGHRHDGARRDRLRPRQPRPRGRPGGRQRARRRGRHRPLGLPEPDQQRAGLPRVLPRPARRGRLRHHRRDDDRRRDRDRRRGRGRRAQPDLHRAQRLRPGGGARGRRSGPGGGRAPRRRRCGRPEATGTPGERPGRRARRAARAGGPAPGERLPGRGRGAPAGAHRLRTR